jgi:RNA recognition motif-containing protein
MSRGQAYIEFENPEQAEKAISYMNGAQIDGMEVR